METINFLVSDAITNGFIIGLTVWGFAYGLNKIFGLFRMLLK